MFAFFLAFSSSGPSNLRLLQAGNPPTHTPTPATVAFGGSQGREKTLTRGLTAALGACGSLCRGEAVGDQGSGASGEQPKVTSLEQGLSPVVLPPSSG